MKPNYFHSRLCAGTLFLSLLFLACLAATARAQTTTFTYQGRLTDQSAAANGTFDLQFALYDAGGAQIGAPQTIEDVVVANGVFTVLLDFGSSAFSGSDRVLEIRIRRGNDTGAFAALAPRQPIAATPYAIRSSTAAFAETATNAANFTGSLSGDVAGAQNSTLVNSVGGKTSTQISTSVEETQNASPNNVANAIVKRNATGGFSFGAINGEQLSLTSSSSGSNSANTQLVVSNSTNIVDATGGVTVFRTRGIFNSGAYNSTFRIQNDGGFVGLGILGFGTIPQSGRGIRLMWHPFKAAFRAGEVGDNGEWNDENIGFYSWAGGKDAKASGISSFAMGTSTVANSSNSVAFGKLTQAKGENSFAAGESSVANGKNSFAFGKSATTTGFFTEDTQIAMGESVTADGGNTIALGQFASTNGFDNSFVYGDGSTTNVINSTAANQFVVRSQRFWFGTNNSVTATAGRFIETSTGAFLSSGGTWTNASSRNLKTNFSAVNSREILQRVLRLPIQTWNYKAEDKTIRHIGAMSQDFYNAFQFGDSREAISTVDADGVALAAIQGLNEELKDELKIRDTEIRQLQEQLKQQQNAIEALKKLVCAGNSKAEICQSGAAQTLEDVPVSKGKSTNSGKSPARSNPMLPPVKRIGNRRNRTTDNK